jgi:hypothetical protein
MREAIIFALDEGRIGDHLGHWDKTGGHGAGCPACIANREAKRRLREALPPVYPALLADQDGAACDHWITVQSNQTGRERCAECGAVIEDGAA